MKCTECCGKGKVKKEKCFWCSGTGKIVELKSTHLTKQEYLHDIALTQLHGKRI